jgi:predicted nucleotidyltransferase component of viral defense system
VIPKALVTEWRDNAPWSQDAQVEQDLVLSRAVVEIFQQPLVAKSLAFRGGTALHKLFLLPPSRYSEDIDLVQIESGPIGDLLDAIRSRLDPWLGDPRRKLGHGRATMIYRFQTSIAPVQPMRLKIEINTREHFSVLGIERRRFEIDSRWFAGGADVSVYGLDELLGTKLRALYQRKKGRDLYDIWRALTGGGAAPKRIVECFRHYTDHGGTPVSRAQFEANLEPKFQDPAFLEDIDPLLRPGVMFDPRAAEAVVRAQLIQALPGDPWKGPP